MCQELSTVAKFLVAFTFSEGVLGGHSLQFKKLGFKGNGIQVTGTKDYDLRSKLLDFKDEISNQKLESLFLLLEIAKRSILGYAELI